MCQIVDIGTWSKKRVSTPASKLGPTAATYVLVPNERLSQLRQFWIDLKAEIEAEDESALQALSRR
jgi:hypothetical protein